MIRIGFTANMAIFSLLITASGHVAAASPTDKFESRIKSTDRDIFKVIDLITGLTELRKGRDKFTSDTEQSRKEESLVKRIMGDRKVLKFEFKSISSDVMHAVTKTGVTWAPTAFYSKYDPETQELFTPPTFDEYLVNWFEKSPVARRKAEDHVPVIPIFHKFTEGRSYPAQNSFGATTMMSNMRYDLFGLVIVDEAQRFLSDNKFKPQPVVIEPAVAREAIKRLVWRVSVELATGLAGKHAIYEWNTYQAATLDDPSNVEYFRSFLGARVLEVKIVDPKTERVFYSYEAPLYQSDAAQAHQLD